MKKLVVFIALSFLFLKVLITLINSLLFRLLWWIIPYILVIGIGEYLTRIMLNASTEFARRRWFESILLTKNLARVLYRQKVLTYTVLDHDERIVTPSVSKEILNSQEIDNTSQLTARQRKRRKKNENRLLKKTKSIDISSKQSSLSFLENTSNLENADFTFDANIKWNLSPIRYIHTLKEENVTKIFSLGNQMSKFYVIDETVFADVDINMSDDFMNYSLYKVMKTDRHVHTAEDLTTDDLTDFLFMTVQTTKQGFIINNDVYLTREKWHTLVPVSEGMYSCTVCQLQCDASSLAVHIESVLHIQNLSIHSPLKKFNLSIIRRINENLHCGVCNVLFPITSYSEHENSTPHEENLLSSINKVCDMCDDFHKTTQNFNANNIRAPNNAPSRLEGIWSDFWPTESDMVSESGRVSESRVSELGRVSESRVSQSGRVSESVDESDNQSEMAESCDGTPEPCDDEIDVFNENFRNVYGDIRIYEEEIEEYCLPIEGVSYASMASKPKLDVPAFLKIDLGTKEVRVKFEHWHMITLTNPKKFYCMVCTESFHVRHKRAHCFYEAHVTKLANCAVVGAFEDYFIRNVSDKLYHCGHCNNLQYKNDMKIHVEKYHPISKKPLKLPAIDQNQTQNLTVKIEQPIEENPVKSVKVEQPIKVNPVKSVKRFDVLGFFKFAPFGVEMTVSNVACHTIMLIVNRFYCAICHVYIQSVLVEHVYEPTHMQLINMTPFIKPFQCNLTRAVRGSLHCAICNILIPVDRIDDHNISTSHTDKLARALGMVKNERPKQEVKYCMEEQREFKTDLDRFLSTLPPDTRGVLSRLKIKNHKGEEIDLHDSSSSIGTPKALLNSPTHRPELTKTNTIYPKNGVESIKPNLGVKHNEEPNVGVKHNEVIYPKNEIKPFHPSQMIPLSVIESKLGVKSYIPKDQIPKRPEEIEDTPKDQVDQTKRPNEIENVQVMNGNNEKNLQVKSIAKAKVPDKKTETERSKSETEDDEETPFVPDEIVLLKLKSAYFKVTASAYHSLVPLGAGLRRCCACSSRLDKKHLRAHVRSRSHQQTLIGHQCTGQLVRQMYHTYHCGFCNVTMSRNEVKLHLEWPPHIERYQAASTKFNKKDLKDMLKHAIEITVETQKGNHKEHSEPIHIITYIQSTQADCTDLYVEKCEKKSQMIILEGKMMKISFESWHGVLVTKGGSKCIICQHEFKTDELNRHLETKYHGVALGMTFEKLYYPALIRKINKNTVNCVTCNLEIPNDESLIYEHTNGRKHVKNHNAIIEKTSHTDSYNDCYKYPITL